MKYYGLVEGFFSKPLPCWTWTERMSMIETLGSCHNLNTYLYCPKNDEFVTKKWDKLYDKVSVDKFKKVISLCKKKNINFVYGINPQLDDINEIVTNSDTYIEKIMSKLKQFTSFEVHVFCILFDDIPFAYNILDSLDCGESKKIASFQAKIVNEIQLKLGQECEVWFCASDYFLSSKSPYLTELTNKLDKKIPLLWTGDKVFTQKITQRMLNNSLKIVQNRKLIWWNNYPVNDPMSKGYFNLGGFNEPEKNIIKKLDGILINPQREALINIPCILTFSQYLDSPSFYSREKSYKTEAAKKFNLTYLQSSLIIEFSNKSEIDKTLKYGFNQFKDNDGYKLRKFFIDIKNLLKQWDRKNLYLNQLKQIKDDLQQFVNLFESKDVENSLKLLDRFPIPVDPTYLNRILMIIMFRYILTQKVLTDAKKYEIGKTILLKIIKLTKVNSLLIDGISIKQLRKSLIYYNNYFKANKKLLSLVTLNLIKRDLKDAIKCEQKEFLNSIKNLNRFEILKIISLRKNLNQYLVDKTLKEVNLF